METLIAVLLFAVGIAFVVKGGDMFVDAAGWVSDVTGISKVVIGATLVSFATTSPEFCVSLIAALKGSNELAVGNAVGSVICNLGIPFACLAAFTPGPVGDALFAMKGQIMIIAGILLFAFCFNGTVSLMQAGILIAIFAFFTFTNIKFSKAGADDKTKRPTNSKEITLNIVKFVAGAACVVFGSNLMVDNGQFVARQFGVSEAVIGLTFVAIGTSLPEIVTSITAIVKKESDISIGNIIGANIMNMTLIMPTCALVTGGQLPVSKVMTFVDLPVAVFLMLLAVLPTMFGQKLRRPQGFLMLAVYVCYLVYVVLFRGA